MRLLLLILVFCTVSFTQISLAQVASQTQQQKPKSGAEQMEDSLQRMKMELLLTTQQVKDLRAVNTDFAKKMETVVSADKTKMRKKNNCVKSRTKTSLSKIYDARAV